MEFGKLPEQELNNIDFRLPAEPEVNKQVLSKGKGRTQVYVGCAKWGRKDWIGKLYPKGTKEKDFLKFYGKRFNSIEFNGFYYNLHSKEQVKKWYDSVPSNFLFCPKFTQQISHFKRLKDVHHEVGEFINVL